jgi:long-subunit acyl-CoA synthetase (AMP-forming)
VETEETLAELLARHAGDRPALRHKRHGRWRSWTWSEVRKEVETLADGWTARGLARGDRVLLVAASRPRVLWELLAVLAAGGAPLLVDPRVARGRDLRAAGARFVVDDHGVSEAPGASGPVQIELLSSTSDGWQSVALPVAALLASARRARARAPLGAGDVALLAEPLADPGTLGFGVARWLLEGVCLALPETPGSVSGDLAEVRPSYLFGGEALYAALAGRARARLPEKRGLARWVVERSPARGLVLRRLARELGVGSVRQAVVVGDALPPADATLLATLGLVPHGTRPVSAVTVVQPEPLRSAG